MLGAIPVPPEGPAWAAWSFDPISVVVLLGVGSAYAAAVTRSRRRATPHPWGAVAWWYAGLAVTALALVSPVDRYADVSFAVHMAQHVLLTLVAPPLLALGAPVTLALRAASPRTARHVTAALRTRPFRVLATPAVAWLGFAAIPWVIHFSPLFDIALRSQVWHAVEHGLWIGAALLLWWPVVGTDPMPHPWRHPVRLLTVFLAMPAMSFLSLAIFVANDPLYPTYAAAAPPWGPAALSSQRDAAVLMWLASSFLLVPAMLAVAVGWKRHDDERQRRLEDRLDLAEGVGAPG
ncbi:MAG TPA: cytochrome c oxidase assembly protein [Actinomycetota bacterium]|nr:cytochrome c oxidase assembly protein [Actinomycetota bacterium]